MAAFEVIALDTATPQLRAPGASDTYTFPRAVEMPLGTANGVLYLDGSKVVTSGSALTFDGTNLGIGASPLVKLQVRTQTNGNLGVQNSVNASGGVRLNSFNDAGNAPSPIEIDGSPVVFNINTTEQMRLTSTGLGIGTSSPAYKLDVLIGAGSGSLFRAGQSGVSNGYTITSNGSALTHFWATTGEAMRLDASGNLGIGTTTTTNGRLNVQAGTAATGNSAFFSNPDGTYNPYLQIQHSSAGVKLFNGSSFGAASNNLIFGNVGTSETMRIDGSGNLGLGVTPSAWLSTRKAFQNGNAAFVSAPSVPAFFQLSANVYTDSGGTDRYISSAASTNYAQVNGQHEWFTSTDPTPTAGNPISFSQVMTLDASGNLGVGATTAGGKLHVRTSAGAVGLILDANASDSNSDSPVIDFRGEATQGQGCRIAAVNTSTFGRKALVFYTSDTASNTYTPTERARITSGGNFVVGTAALATTATDGFLYVPTCAGTPTGTPTTQTGTAPIVVDTTNNKLYFYSGGQWRDAGP